MFSKAVQCVTIHVRSREGLRVSWLSLDRKRKRLYVPSRICVADTSAVEWYVVDVWGELPLRTENVLVRIDEPSGVVGLDADAGGMGICA